MMHLGGLDVSDYAGMWQEQEQLLAASKRLDISAPFAKCRWNKHVRKFNFVEIWPWWWNLGGNVHFCKLGRLPGVLGVKKACNRHQGHTDRFISDSHYQIPTQIYKRLNHLRSTDDEAQAEVENDGSSLSLWIWGLWIRWLNIWAMSCKWRRIYLRTPISNNTW